MLKDLRNERTTQKIENENEKKEIRNNRKSKRRSLVNENTQLTIK